LVAVCDSMGYVSASPASVHDVIENVNLQSALEGKRAWLGLSRPDATADWGWEDDSDMDFVYWDSGEPSSSGNCAVINYNNVTSQWGAEDCSTPHPAICQVTALSGCLVGWSEKDSKCYWFSGTDADTLVTWQQASEECFVRGPWGKDGQLASGHSAEENDFLYSLRSGVLYTWIGLHRANSSASWTWTDGSVVNFTNWQSGQPTSGYDCASLTNSSPGQWRSEPCPSKVDPFLCQVDYIY